jgi:hypothetical protein
MQVETHTKQDTVVVTFNGEEKVLTYQLHEQVTAVLNRAMNAFGIQSNRHLMSLFTEAGIELPDKSSMQNAGVTPGVVLILRQSQVKGG